MLAHDAQAERAPIERQAVLNLLAQALDPFGEGRALEGLAAQGGVDLRHEPGPAHGRPADHHTMGAGGRKRGLRILRAADIAIGDDRKCRGRHRVGDRAPVGLALVELAARAAMHGDHIQTRPFGMVGEVRRVQPVIVPAKAHLQSDGRVAGALLGGLDHRLCEVGRSHQRRSRGPSRHLARRTAHIDVDHVHSLTRQHAGTLAHVFRPPPGNLHNPEALAGMALGPAQDVPTTRQQHFPGNHFRHDRWCTEFKRLTAEGCIGCPGHGRKPGSGWLKFGHYRHTQHKIRTGYAVCR